MRLSQADFSFIREMRSENMNVFEDAVPDKLRSHTRLVACQCGDGHRFGDWFSHLSKQLCCDAELIHPITINGGALTLGYQSPLANRNGREHDMVCLDNIIEGCNIKQTKTVLLGVHFPCGMAVNSGLSALQVLKHFISAKKRLRDHIPGVEPIMLVHVDYDGYVGEKGVVDRFRTYFFNRKRFDEWERATEKEQEAA